MATPDIGIERDGDIAILRLQRAPANAIELGLCRAVAAAYDELMASPPGALVITGSGRFFSGGLDLKTVPTYVPEQQRELILALNAMVGKLYGCPIPVVGAINGHAIAGGFILALCPDYRVGPEGTALFGLTEARVGIPFPAAPLIVLQGELAPPDVRYITLLSRKFGPEEALARGVLDELAPAAAVLERAVEVARDFATIPAEAYRRIKQQVRADALAKLDEVNARQSDPMLGDWITADAADASAAVLRGS